MTDSKITFRLHHSGEFFKKKYVGGKCETYGNMDLDLFSYSVLMEWVKDLNFTEIGGVYVKELNGDWKLVLDDVGVCQAIKKSKNGEFDFYIDCNVEEGIAAMDQMQPHVIVRPRKNPVQAKVRNPGKKKFVTIKDINNQKEQMKNSRKKDINVVASPVKEGNSFKATTEDGNEKKTEMLMGLNEYMKIFEDSAEYEELPRGDEITKNEERAGGKKLANNEPLAENNVEGQGFNKYELSRLKRVAENDRKMAELGLRRMSTNLCVKEKVRVEVPNDNESYCPNNDVDQESDDEEATSKVHSLLYIQC